MSTLGTFRFWPHWDFGHIGDIGHIHQDIGHIQILATLGLWGHWAHSNFGHIGTLGTLGRLGISLRTLATFTFWPHWDFGVIGHIGDIHEHIGHIQFTQVLKKRKRRQLSRTVLDTVLVLYCVQLLLDCTGAGASSQSGSARRRAETNPKRKLTSSSI